MEELLENVDQQDQIDGVLELDDSKPRARCFSALLASQGLTYAGGAVTKSGVAFGKPTLRWSPDAPDEIKVLVEGIPLLGSTEALLTKEACQRRRGGKEEL